MEPSLLVAEVGLALVDDVGRFTDGDDAVASLLPGARAGSNSA